MSDKVMDGIIDEMVVFRHENGTYFSNSPYWADSGIRDAWIAKHSDEAKKEQADFDAKAQDYDGDGDVDDDDMTYAEMTNEDLRTELAGRNLSVDGKKADLIKRLEEDDATGE